jgi:hypothetical protein
VVKKYGKNIKNATEALKMEKQVEKMQMHPATESNQHASLQEQQTKLDPEMLTCTKWWGVR